MFKGSEIFATAIVCGPLIAGEVWSNSRTEDALGVAISPRMLILGKDQGGAVTVHTQIPYINVDTSSFTLDGIPSDSVWYDDCGNIVPLQRIRRGGCGIPTQRCLNAGRPDAGRAPRLPAPTR